MFDWPEIYKKNSDGFLYAIDFINQHPAISADAKKSAISAIVDDLVRPSYAMRVISNPQTHKDLGGSY